VFDQPILETARLRLRPFVLTDAPHVRVLAGAREVADTTLNIPHPYPAGAAETWIATHQPMWAAGHGAVYAVTDVADGGLLGAVSLVRTPAKESAELGYWLAVSAWGRGYATEAATAVCQLGFTTLGLHRIQARYLCRNPASGRVLQKLGMRDEGILRDAVSKWGRFEDVAVSAILAPTPTPPRSCVDHS